MRNNAFSVADSVEVESVPNQTLANKSVPNLTDNIGSNPRKTIKDVHITPQRKKNFIKQF